VDLCAGYSLGYVAGAPRAIPTFENASAASATLSINDDIERVVCAIKTGEGTVELVKDRADRRLTFLLGGRGSFCGAIDGGETVTLLASLEGEEFRDVGTEVLPKVAFMLGQSATDFVENEQALVFKDTTTGALARCGFGENTDDVLMRINGFVDGSFIKDLVSGVLDCDDLVFRVTELGVAVNNLLREGIDCVEGS
jgi:hypothetical protein